MACWPLLRRRVHAVAAESDVTGERRHPVSGLRAGQAADFCPFQRLPDMLGVDDQLNTVAAVGPLAVSADEHPQRHPAVWLPDNRHSTFDDARYLRKRRRSSGVGPWNAFHMSTHPCFLA